MIEKLLRLERRLEPAHYEPSEQPPLDKSRKPNSDPSSLRPAERAVRKVILYNPAFGESRPGEEFPPWLIPAKMRPPDCAEWKQFSLLRSELREEDLIDDDPFSRCLRPCLRDPRRLDLLGERRDLKPHHLDEVKDTCEIALLKRRKDLQPGDLKKLGRKVRSALAGRVPPNALGAIASGLTEKAMRLMMTRPDLKPEQLASLLVKMARQTQNQPEVDLPLMYSRALSHLGQQPELTPGQARMMAQSESIAGLGSTTSGSSSSIGFRGSVGSSSSSSSSSGSASSNSTSAGGGGASS